MIDVGPDTPGTYTIWFNGWPWRTQVSSTEPYKAVTSKEVISLVILGQYWPKGTIGIAMVACWSIDDHSLGVFLSGRIQRHDRGLQKAISIDLTPILWLNDS